MVRCQSCGTENRVGSQYCDECGTKLVLQTDNGGLPETRPQVSGGSGIRAVNITSIGVPPLVQSEAPETDLVAEADLKPKGSHARLIIERGASVDTEFDLSAEESNIGRWDADNGIFPDVDLDAHDPDAKVSRRHARIIFRNDKYMVEDLGSTNGTFINRGRRLLAGSPQVLSEGDEIIVGKTFLRFRINR
ncbi:MAG: FHA domain-containing protein [Pyrinomonadaceae bacterium]